MRWGLQDVVVTGFQQINKDKFTGSAVTLKTDDVKIDGLPDVSRMLEGRAAGVSIQNVSGTFGAAPKIRIRGATSLNGCQQTALGDRRRCAGGYCEYLKRPAFQRRPYYVAGFGCCRS